MFGHTRKNGQVLAAAAMLMAVSVADESNKPVEQRNAPPLSLRQLVDVANAAANKRCEKAAKDFESRLGKLKTKADCHSFARAVIGLEEKATQLGELTGLSSTDRKGRMVSTFRQHVLDDTTLVEEMTKEFRRIEGLLINESIQLYLKAGVDAKTAAGVWKPCEIHPEVWQQEFAQVHRRAMEMGQADWLREGAVWVGSGIVADAVQEAGHSTGLMPYHRGGWLDAAVGLLTQIAIDGAAQAVTNPSEGFAKELSTEFDAACLRISKGPNGLISAIRKITQVHQQARKIHLGLVRKEGAK